MLRFLYLCVAFSLHLTLCAIICSFEPATMKDICRAFNQSSTASYLISYKRPQEIINKYKFQVAYIGQLRTSMYASSSGHTCYFFCRVPHGNAVGTQQLCTGSGAEVVPCDPLFQTAWELCKSESVPKIQDHVDLQNDIFLGEPVQRKRKKPDRLTCG